MSFTTKGCNKERTFIFLSAALAALALIALSASPASATACEGAHLVFDVSLEVHGEGCGSPLDNTTIEVPVNGTHDVTGVANLICEDTCDPEPPDIDLCEELCPGCPECPPEEPATCEVDPGFFMEINSQNGTSVELTGECGQVFHDNSLGSFDFTSGANDAIMHFDSSFATEGCTGIGLTQLCIYYNGGFCGDGDITPGEECEPPFEDEGWSDNPYCPQELGGCVDESAMTWARDAFGDCNYYCECVYDDFEPACVAGECGAECDSGTAFLEEDGTCFYGCDSEETCSFQDSCSTDDYIEDGILYSNGQCSADGCFFDETECGLSVGTDKGEYFQGSWATASGTYLDMNCTPVADAPVSLEIFPDADPVNETLSEESVTNPDGSFSLSFRLSRNATLGPWTVLASSGEDSDSASFTVLDGSECVDNDDDGYFDINDTACDGDDWDDDDPTVYPGAPELCDSKDNDQDGQIDEGLTRQCGSTDTGICAYGVETCSAGEWGGCTAVFPAAEACGDGKDNDCDGQADEGCSTGASGGGSKKGGGGGGCFSVWNCTEWEECQADGTQARVCTDKNGCFSAYNRPNETQPCEYAGGCDELWSCSEWSECSEDIQVRACRDISECGTEEGRPLETQACEAQEPGGGGDGITGLTIGDFARAYWWAILIVVVLIIAGVLWIIA